MPAVIHTQLSQGATPLSKTTTVAVDGLPVATPGRHRCDGDREGLVGLVRRVHRGLHGEAVRGGVGRDGDAGRAAAVVRAVRRAVRARDVDRRGSCSGAGRCSA